MNVAAIGDNTLSGYNTYWLNITDEIGSWVTASSVNSLAWKLNADEKINRAGNKPLVHQALEISIFEPDLVIIAYGQDQICQGGSDPTGEIELAISILRKSFIILIPAQNLEAISNMQRDKSLCSHRCLAADAVETGLVNYTLAQLADGERVFYFPELEDSLVFQDDFNERDCINPSALGGSVFAKNVYNVFRNAIRGDRGR